MPIHAHTRAKPTPYAALLLALSVLLAVLLPAGGSWAAPGTASEDCTAVQLGTHHGSFTATDRSDCLVLPLTSGARIAALSPYPEAGPGARTAVVDAAGSTICDTRDVRSGACHLVGTGPFKAMVTAGSDEGVGDYLLAFYRSDTQDCPVLPAGDFTSAGPAARFTTGSGTFSHCFSIPADHARTEQLQLRGLSGGLPGWVDVVGPDGSSACSVGGDLPSGAGCFLAPGTPYTVLFHASDAPAEFSLTRRDVTGTAKGCTVTAATAVGAPSRGGTLLPEGGYRCRQVTTAAAGDVLHLNVRDPLGTANMFVFGSDGSYLSCNRNSSCAATGSTRYQVLIYVPYWLKTADTYRFDAQRIATSAGPAPECKKVANINYGYGPLSGRLDERHTAVCLALPTSYNAHFDVSPVDTAGGHEAAVPALYGPGSVNHCYGVGDSGYSCYVAGPLTDKVVPSIFVLGLPEKASATAYRAELVCSTSTCGVEKLRASSPTPATGVTGTTATVTVRGNSLHTKYRFEIYRSGKRIPAKVVSVSEDRKTLKAEFDLKGAAAGEWNVVYDSVRLGYFTVTASPLKATVKPVITGTPKVGAVLKASHGTWTPAPDAYAYQWKADGVAVAGATSSRFTVPASLAGKRLTVTVRASSKKYGSRPATSAPVGPVRRG
ncbi:hypothetical protein [Streptomyces sp. NPDC089919]|uniref:hypothetical protein n=1 Tax=Streptomyces sp. NPDC089919 TaxID=3155188 RepID=UPI003429CF6B